MKVLVTGAGGFIGGTVADHLMGRPRWDVVGLDRVPPRDPSYTFPMVRCDLLRADQLEEALRWERPDAVFHAAAQARVDPSVSDPLGTYDLNVQASLNLMRACKAVGVKHLVVASSEAVYGRARTYPSPENNDFAPANPYAASKVAMDVMVQQFDRVVPSCVVRSGMGFGPRSSPREQVVAKFITKALRDEPLMFPAGDVVHPTRDLNHVQDFARGIEAIIEHQARGVFNLSGGREYSVLELAERIVKACGSGRVEFTDEYSYRDGEAGFRTWLDVSKAREVLGHEPQNHFEGEALHSTIKWYADNPEYFDAK